MSEPVRVGTQRSGAGAPVRRRVTVLVCDIEDSTHLGWTLDVETYGWVLETYATWARGIVEHHGGAIEKYIGDAVVAVFGTPVERASDPWHAARAAIELRDTLPLLNASLAPRLPAGLRVRVGLEHGEVVDPSDGGRVATGRPLVVASRVQQLAASCEIAAGPGIVETLGARASWSRAGTTTLHPSEGALVISTLVNVDETLRYVPPLLGRQRELERLAHEAQRSVGGPSIAVAVVGEAGIGKSRLLREFLDLTASARSAVAQCHPNRVAQDWTVVAELVAGTLEIMRGASRETMRTLASTALSGDPDAERLVERIIAVANREFDHYDHSELEWAVRRTWSRLARDKPLVLALEDVHYTDGVPLLVRALVPESSALLLATSRPRADGLVPAADRLVQLGPLAARHATQLAALVLDRDHAIEVARAARGNPLLVLALAEQQARATQSGSVDVDARAVFATRHDELAPLAATVAQVAAVEGPECDVALVHACVPDARPPELALAFEQLTVAGLADTTAERVRFRHDLVRDVIYDRTTKGTRRAVHEQMARTLARAGDLDGPARAGQHYERAAELAAELQASSAEIDALHHFAGEHFAIALRRAIDRDDLHASKDLAAHMRRPLDLHDPVRIRTELLFTDRLHFAGELDAASTLARETLDAARTVDPVLADLATIRLWHVDRHASGEGVWSLANRPDVRAAIERCVASSDDFAIAEAERARVIDNMTADAANARSRAILEQAIAAARRADLRALEVINVVWLAHMIAWGPEPVADATARIRQLLSRDLGLRFEGLVSGALAIALAAGGDLAEARRIGARASHLLDELGFTVEWSMTMLYLAAIEVYQGDPRRALEMLLAVESTPEIPREHLCNVNAFAAVAEARAGSAELALERADRALTLTYDDPHTNGTARFARCAALTACGRHDEAVEAGEAALDWLRTFDEPTCVGYAWRTLAAAYQAAGRADEARDAVNEAVRLFEQKGDVGSLDSLRSWLAGIH